MSAQNEEGLVLSLWNIPVYVMVGDGVSETINGPDDALTYLSIRWPTERGPAYRKAVAACKSAVHQYGSLDNAREAFVAAAIEASMLD
jgi:hypothetical protein